VRTCLGYMMIRTVFVRHAEDLVAKAADKPRPVLEGGEPQAFVGQKFNFRNATIQPRSKPQPDAQEEPKKKLKVSSSDLICSSRPRSLKGRRILCRMMALVSLPKVMLADSN
jgi:hypothetical protein